MAVGRFMMREARVAFSTRAQPIWFRVVKWIVFITVGVFLWRSPYFWWIVLGAFVISLALHGFWRWKTKGWTQPWGGWNDPQQ